MTAPRQAHPALPPAIPPTNTAVRPPPARRGQPASLRDFERSSAGGAASHLGVGASASVQEGGGGHGAARGGDATTPERAEERDDESSATGLSKVQRRKQERWKDTYIPEEETIRNDYAGQYVQTGARPQNYLRNTAVETRFAEYPKLASLLEHKHALTASPRHSIPPTYLNVPLDNTLTPSTSLDPNASPMSRALSSLTPSRFDSILLTPPPETTYEELAALDLGRIAANPGFVWLWVGSGQSPVALPSSSASEGDDGSSSAVEVDTNQPTLKRQGDGIGLEKGRELLSLWGYRRCEDIVWLKTNKRDPEADLTREPTSLFTPTLEHCLMGIRGTVRRSTDSFLVHCNVDTDVIIWEGDEQDPDLKPPELQSLIENFCLGTRRLHLYGSPHSLRRGWLTLSSPSSSTRTTARDRPTFSTDSIVHPIEREGSAQEQRERWGAPREWTRDEWVARWKKPGMPVTMLGATGTAGMSRNGSQQQQQGADGEVNKVQRVDTLLPYVEELDALRPKSPPPRDGLPSSGGLGRGRGAGLGVTRSGLVSQSSSLNPFSPNQAPFANSGAAGGRGRGRGRGRSNGPPTMRDEVLLMPGPMRHDVVPPRMPVTRPPPPPMGMSYPSPHFSTPQQHPYYPPPQQQQQQQQFYTQKYSPYQQQSGYPSPSFPPMPPPTHGQQAFPFARSYSSPATSSYGPAAGENYSPQPPFAPPQQQQQQYLSHFPQQHYFPGHFPSPMPQQAYLAQHAGPNHLASGIGSLSLSSPASGASDIVYPISSRSSDGRSRVPSSAASTSGTPYEDAPGM
ncbi:hypothetical protein JCM10908_000110 [Rhodotorula pacifica]|uniref:Kar4p n=1 Tax=Rhodotorula pacifica TaxID=1495444 RepID=UPI00316EFA15